MLKAPEFRNKWKISSQIFVHSSLAGNGRHRTVVLSRSVRMAMIVHYAARILGSLECRSGWISFVPRNKWKAIDNFLEAVFLFGGGRVAGSVYKPCVSSLISILTRNRRFSLPTRLHNQFVPNFPLWRWVEYSPSLNFQVYNVELHFERSDR